MLQTNNVQTLGSLEKLDFFDFRSVSLPTAIEPIEAWKIIMSRPQPILKIAFRIRDAISSLFGVKRIHGFSGRYADRVKEGDKLDFFIVEAINPNVLVLTERDSHLDVMTCISTVGKTLTVTSSVIYHNWFGRIYMIPVGPAHKIIVNRMLKNLQRDLLKQEQFSSK